MKGDVSSRTVRRLWLGCSAATCAAALLIVTIVGMRASADLGRTTGTASEHGFKCSATGSRATKHVPVTGAAPNGSRDSSAAIQNAIDLAGRRGGGIVTLPAGTFMVNNALILENNVELTGIGPKTVIKAGPNFLSTQAPGGGYPVITTAGASDTTIARLTADQSDGTLRANVIARLAGYLVEGLNSENVLIDDVYTRNPFTYSIAMVRSADFCIEHCNTLVSTSNRYDQLDGIHILDSSSGQVIDNVVQSGDDGLAAHTISGPVYDVLYANNIVHGGSIADGMQLAVGDYPIYDIRIEDNDFYGSRYGIRTGYYDDHTGAVYNIYIHGNYIHGLARGRQSPAIYIGGFGGLGSIRNITVTNNDVCNVGSVTVSRGLGNVVRGTKLC